jgi:hypothetical protein
MGALSVKRAEGKALPGIRIRHAASTGSGGRWLHFLARVGRRKGKVDSDVAGRCAGVYRTPDRSGDGMKRFTAYRRNISIRTTHNSLQKNADSEPQFEGVIWSDGSVALRWLTACRSTSVWANLADCLAIHGHPEYGTEIIWHDDAPPAEWLKQLAACKAKL